MKKKNILIGIFFILCINFANATNLRGEIMGFNSYTGYSYPYPGAQVVLWIGNTPVTSYTDNYGMYYFFNIPPGVYTIVVNGGVYTNTVSVMNIINAWEDIPAITI